MTRKTLNRLLIFGAFFVLLFVIITSGVLSGTLPGLNLNDSSPRENIVTKINEITREDIIQVESAIIKAAEDVSPSVVTVTVQTPRRRVVTFDPFGGGLREDIQGGVDRDIGTGFIISEDGLIVTNKHVVDDSEVDYKVVTSDDTEYEVQQISRDPSNDIAIVKINASGLKPVKLGNSDSLKVGQFVIAIGTALGEFRHTVTTGVISGLGRGISAGNPFQGFVEQIDNVIQTDAAINPGNSGGPLLNSLGEVIGVNVAVAQGAENVGFAIPINIVKEGIDAFNVTGSFPARAFLGVQYQMIDQRTAVVNELPQGAYVLDVVPDSPASEAGLQADDIIISIDGNRLTEDNDLASVLSTMKPGLTVLIDVVRAGSSSVGQDGNQTELQLTATLSASEE